MDVERFRTYDRLSKKSTILQNWLLCFDLACGMSCRPYLGAAQQVYRSPKQQNVERVASICDRRHIHRLGAGAAILAMVHFELIPHWYRFRHYKTATICVCRQKHHLCCAFLFCISNSNSRSFTTVPSAIMKHCHVEFHEYRQQGMELCLQLRKSECLPLQAMRRMKTFCSPAPHRFKGLRKIRLLFAADDFSVNLF